MSNTSISDIAINIENAKALNFEQYNEVIRNKILITKETLVNCIYNNYLSKIIGKENTQLVIDFSKRIVEHITGNYDIGLNSSFEELNEDASIISSLISELDNEELSKDKSLEVLVDGSVSEGLIYEDKKDLASKLYEQYDIEQKSIFSRALKGIKQSHDFLVDSIAKLSGFDLESNNLNDNYIRKFFGGIAFELVSGTLFDKRHFVNVINSNIMLDKIRNEGIIHFTSLDTANKILESGYIKPSSFLESDLTSKKCFFFAGVPKFEDLLINIPAYYVMSAVKIKPTEEQISNLKYRAINDGALAYDGKLYFDKENAELVYYALKYNNENNTLYFDEISKEEALTYEPSEEVKNTYNYKQDKNSIIDEIKMNAYGLFAEFKHYDRLRKVLENHKLNELTDDMLEELRDIDEANAIKSR